MGLCAPCRPRGMFQRALAGTTRCATCQARHERANAPKPPPYEIRLCPVCWEDIEPRRRANGAYEFRSNYEARSTCSASCGAKLGARKRKPAPRAERRLCKRCKEPFGPAKGWERQRARFARRRFCGSHCRAVASHWNRHGNGASALAAKLGR